MAFDLAVLLVCFKAFRYSPPLGTVALGYLIGQLGGNVPIPGGFGGLDAGLIGTFALYHQPACRHLGRRVALSRNLAVGSGVGWQRRVRAAAGYVEA
jgi:hypothetical protein